MHAYTLTREFNSKFNSARLVKLHNPVTFVYANGLHMQKHIPTYTHAIILVHFMFQIPTSGTTKPSKPSFLEFQTKSCSF